MQAELIKNEKVSDRDMVQFRENFVKHYCISKNWDKCNLSFEQILEIRSHHEWKTPGMVRS
jgi:hypothetical protein